MIKTFTQTDLIKYLYQETTEKETREIEIALNRDSELQILYNDLRAMKNALEDVRLEPASSTILSILSHSKLAEVKRT